MKTMFENIPDTDALYGPYALADPQQAQVYGFCSLCGGELYSPDDELCYDCQKKGNDANMIKNTLIQQVIDIHNQNPDATASMIAKQIGETSGHVRTVASRAGITLPYDRCILKQDKKKSCKCGAIPVLGAKYCYACGSKITTPAQDMAENIGIAINILASSHTENADRAISLLIEVRKFLQEENV